MQSDRRTRFQNHPEFKPFIDNMNKIENKIKSLKEEAKGFEEYTLDYDKCEKKLIVLEILHADFIKEIKEFDEEKPSKEFDEEKENAFDLALKLLARIGKTVSNPDNVKTLEEPRNNNKKNANKLIHWGSVTGTFLFALVQSFTLIGAAVTAVLGGTLISAITRYVAGIKDNSPESAKLVAESCWTLKATIEQLDKYLMEKRPLAHMVNKGFLAVTR